MHLLQECSYTIVHIKRRTNSLHALSQEIHVCTSSCGSMVENQLQCMKTRLTLQRRVQVGSPEADGLQRSVQETDASRIASIPVLLQDLSAHAVQHPAALYAGDPFCACPGTQQCRDRASPARHKLMCACVRCLAQRPDSL